MGRIIRIYMTLGAIFGVLLGAPGWYAALFAHAVPSGTEQIKSVLIMLLVATIRGVLRAFAWLPSLVYNVGMHRHAFETWLFSGWW